MHGCFIWLILTCSCLMCCECEQNCELLQIKVFAAGSCFLYNELDITLFKVDEIARDKSGNTFVGWLKYLCLEILL